ncbi:MAG: Ig-like domain-containing protein, partial [Verrucomicrobiota bacterium]|nr:Ig-like domain-containing protein [Verrucomicrobiota bacterium]
KTTILISKSSITGKAGNGNSYYPSVSYKAGFVTFSSDATDLNSIKTGNNRQIFLWREGNITLISKYNEEVANSSAFKPVLSASGNAVIFESDADNLGSSTNGEKNIYLYKTDTEELQKISVSTVGDIADADSSFSSVSYNASYIAFSSKASNLVENDSNAKRDIFVRNMFSNTTELISTSLLGSQADNDCYGPAISANGRFVYFYSKASNLVTINTNDVRSGYICDRQAPIGHSNRLRLLSHGIITSESGNNDTWSGALSASGRFVVFASDSTNLISTDINGVRDIFIADFGISANQSPVAELSTYTVDVDDGESIDIEISAMDPNGDDIFSYVTTFPTHGTVSFSGSAYNNDALISSYTYISENGYSEDSFEIRIIDGSGSYDDVIVAIQVSQPPSVDLDNTKTGNDYQTLLHVNNPDFISIVNSDELIITSEKDLESASVAIENLLTPISESLSINTGGTSISSSYNEDTGTLSLYGIASSSDYQQVLRTVTYKNSNPNSDMTTRNIAFNVYDGESNSITVYSKIFFVNDTIQLELLSGWNLLSLPFDTAPWSETNDVLSDNIGKILFAGSVWYWDAEEEIGYKRQEFSFSANRGFWAFSNQEESATTDWISGKLPLEEIILHLGWNLIGPSQDMLLTEFDELICIGSFVWKWDTQKCLYLPEKTLVQRGKGYWVFIEKN